MEELTSHLSSESRSCPTLIGLVGLLRSEVLVGDTEGDELVHEHAK